MEHFEITIPAKNPVYIPDQLFDDLSVIYKSRQFFPVFISGESGIGKTEAALQAAAAANREIVRVNITAETDETDLIGGFRLKESDSGQATETTFEAGPVIRAMQAGALLLLDEVDLGTSKIMCLQSIMEGKPYFIKKINKLVHPAPGFNVIATANTKGKGSLDGRFIGTNIMNEAFLERFPITFNVDFPNKEQETLILDAMLDKLNLKNKANQEYAGYLITWANNIRTSFKNSAVDYVISTRRLLHIITTLSLFRSVENAQRKALELCLNRFTEEEKQALLVAFDAVIPDKKQKAEDDELFEGKEFTYNTTEELQQMIQKLQTRAAAKSTTKP